MRGDPGRLRRRAAADRVDEVHAGPHHGRGERAGRGRLRAGHRARVHPAHHQPPGHRPRVRDRLRAKRVGARGPAGGAEQRTCLRWQQLRGAVRQVRGMTAITAWSAVSPFGYGHAEFTTGLAERRTAHRVPNFVIAERLGPKGTGSMDRSSGLAVDATGLLLAEVGTDEQTGVVLGTTSGSTHTQFEVNRESLIRRRPYTVNPAVMPFALMNGAAAQCAIRHGLTGPNTTLASGRMAGLAVLRYAARLLATGRASGVVCGAVEEYSEARAGLERQAWGLPGDYPLGEGAAVLFLAPGGGGLAGLVTAGTRFAPGRPARRPGPPLPAVPAR